MNIFEKATRIGLRFPSPKGSLSVEDLWQLPLQSKSGPDLDTIARTANSSLRAVSEESFVSTRTDPKKSTYELQLEIAKHIIAVKQTENAEAAAKVEKAQKKAKLLEVLARKQDAALEQLSPEELVKQIEELS